MSTFNGTSAGESPARATLTLILDSGDGTLGPPIDIDSANGVGIDHDIEGMNFVISSNIHSIVNRNEFRIGQIGKAIDTHLESSGFGIPRIHKVQIALIYSIAVFLFR